jgi:hypothetical protein
MSLSFKETKNSRPIAIVDGGNHAGKMVWLSDDHNLLGGASEINPSTLLDPSIFHDGKRNFTQAEIQRIHHAIKAGYASPEILADERLGGLFQKAKGSLAEKVGRDIKLSSGKFQPLPMDVEGQREVLQIGAPSGAGKSYFASRYADVYHTMFPNRPILLLSRKNEDQQFDKFPFIKRVDLDSIVEHKLEPEELRNSLLIFDDIETLDSPVKEAVYSLKDDMLITGRSYNIAMLLVTHLTRAGHQTRIDNNESTGTVVFKHGNAMHNRALLKDYIGLDKKTVDKILASNSRWMMIHKHVPMYCLTENEVFLI